MKTVAAAIIRRNQSVLLARRGPGDPLAGQWEFPGGKLEPGETVQVALERELREELGIETRAGAELVSSEYHYDHGAFRIVAVETTIVSGEAVPTVHDKIGWVPLGRLLDYPLLPADIPIAEHLLQAETES